MTQDKLSLIAEGYYDYFLANFKHASKIGYFQVQVGKYPNQGVGELSLTLCFGAGWCNTPWHEELMLFVDNLNMRVKAKYPNITQFNKCGYSSNNEIQIGGLIDERKLAIQMRYPEKY